MRWVRPTIAHIPRGFRTTLSSGRALAALGGANSVDFGNRVEGQSWWPQESITDKEPGALGQEQADVLIGHDAPSPLPTLDYHLVKTDHFWSLSGRAYAAAGRQMFTRGFIEVWPELYLGGHYHHHLDETVSYSVHDNPFETRVVLLDMNGSEQSRSQSILDTQTLDLQFFGRSDTTVTELTGREEGRWLVTTDGSSHILDFHWWSTAQVPGADAAASFDDREQPLLALESYKVGERGYWPMKNDGLSAPMAHDWHLTSEIQRIERVTEKSISAVAAEHMSLPANRVGRVS